MPRAAILDIDGTLMDTNYHHAVAWFRALRQHDIVVPLWKIHRHIGMGGDQMVTALTDEHTEAEVGDELRAAESALYLAMIDEVQPLPDAGRLVDALQQAGSPIVLASSAKQREVDHYLDVLDLRERIVGWTTSADVRPTQPHPDLIKAAMEKVPQGMGSVMVGDSTWDCEAAQRAKIPSIGVLTGGFSERELKQAGAARVFQSLGELIDALPRIALAES